MKKIDAVRGGRYGPFVLEGSGVGDWGSGVGFGKVCCWVCEGFVAGVRRRVVVGRATTIPGRDHFPVEHDLST